MVSPAWLISLRSRPGPVYFKLKDATGDTKVKVDSIDYLLDTEGDSIPDIYDDDDDGDGLPDTWEDAHGFDPLDPADAQADADADGLINLQEFRHNIS